MYSVASKSFPYCDSFRTRPDWIFMKFPLSYSMTTFLPRLGRMLLLALASAPLLFTAGCVSDFSTGPGLGGLPLPFGIFGNNGPSYYDRNTYYTSPPPNRYRSSRYYYNPSRKVYYNSPTQYYDRKYNPGYYDPSYNRNVYYNNRYRSYNRNNDWHHDNGWHGNKKKKSKRNHHD